MTQYKINIGDKIPYFELNDQNGEPFTSDSLLGAPFVIYFYPKDDTPGCTTQACTFRDALEKFNDIGVAIVGISSDSVASHKKFSEKWKLNFPLLSDPTHEIAILFDVWQEKTVFGKKAMGIERSTFLMDGTGKIVWDERRVEVVGNAERLLAAVRQYT